MNLPPTTDGLIDERDVERLKELRALLDREFGTELPAKVTLVNGSPETQPLYEIAFEQPVSSIKYVVLQEEIAEGQRVESFRITADFGSGNQFPMYQGTCIGNKKICRLYDPFKDQNPLQSDMKDGFGKLYVKVTAARDTVNMKSIRIYGFVRNSI